MARFEQNIKVKFWEEQHPAQTPPSVGGGHLSTPHGVSNLAPIGGRPFLPSQSLKCANE